jgi:putative MATE family efflux protein
MATGYLRITFLEFIFTYISAVIASALRGIGNSITPMIFMIAGTVLNAVFDPLLIIGIGPFPKLGLNGAAFASLIAFAVTTIVLVIYMYTKYRDKPITFKKLAFDRKILASVLHIGFPSFVQNALFSVSSAFMISFVNGFGENAISGFGIATRIESIAILPGMAVMMAISTLTAQHFGVNKVKRIKDIFKWGAVLNASMVFVVSGLILIFAQPLVSLFVSNKAIIDI